MKKFILPVMLLLSMNSFANEKGNGGDPIRVYATDFPSAETLKSAKEIVRERVSKSLYMDEFKAAMIEELNELDQNDRIKYIPKDMVLLPNFSNYPYMVSVGAITELEKGSLIYLTKQSVNYSAKELARVLLQELPHHILRNGLEKDEAFINSLGELIIDGTFIESVNKRLERVFYKNEFKMAEDLIGFAKIETNCVKAPESSNCRCDDFAYQAAPMVRVRLNRHLKDSLSVKDRPRNFTTLAAKKAVSKVGNRCISVVELGDYIQGLLTK